MDYWLCVSVCLCVSVFSRERHNVQMLRASLSETSGRIILSHFYTILPTESCRIMGNSNQIKSNQIKSNQVYLVTHIINSMYISLKVMWLRRSSRNPLGLITRTTYCTLFSGKRDFRTLMDESSVHLPTNAHPCSGRDYLKPEMFCRGAAEGYRRGSPASRAGNNEPSLWTVDLVTQMTSAEIVGVDTGSHIRAHQLAAITTRHLPFLWDLQPIIAYWCDVLLFRPAFEYPSDRCVRWALVDMVSEVGHEHLY